MIRTVPEAIRSYIRGDGLRTVPLRTLDYFDLAICAEKLEMADLRYEVMSVLRHMLIEEGIYQNRFCLVHIWLETQSGSTVRKLILDALYLQLIVMDLDRKFFIGQYGETFAHWEVEKGGWLNDFVLHLNDSVDMAALEEGNHDEELHEVPVCVPAEIDCAEAFWSWVSSMQSLRRLAILHDSSFFTFLPEETGSKSAVPLEHAELLRRRYFQSHELPMKRPRSFASAYGPPPHTTVEFEVDMPADGQQDDLNQTASDVNDEETSDQGPTESESAGGTGYQKLVASDLNPFQANTAPQKTPSRSDRLAPATPVSFTMSRKRTAPVCGTSSGVYPRKAQRLDMSEEPEEMAQDPTGHANASGPSIVRPQIPVLDVRDATGSKAASRKDISPTLSAISEANGRTTVTCENGTTTVAARHLERAVAAGSKQDPRGQKPQNRLLGYAMIADVERFEQVADDDNSRAWEGWVGTELISTALVAEALQADTVQSKLLGRLKATCRSKVVSPEVAMWVCARTKSTSSSDVRAFIVDCLHWVLYKRGIADYADIVAEAPLTVRTGMNVDETRARLVCDLKAASKQQGDTEEEHKCFGMAWKFVEGESNDAKTDKQK